MFCQRDTAMVMQHSQAATSPVPAPSDRVSDDDRQGAAGLVTRAFADGLLAVDEVDERLSAVYAAATVADLQAVTADLPTDWLQTVRAAAARRRRSEAAGAGRAAAIRSFVRVMALLLAIWLVVGVATGSWYPWPVWPALGWGVPLLFGRGHGHHGPAGAAPLA